MTERTDRAQVVAVLGDRAIFSDDSGRPSVVSGLIDDLLFPGFLFWSTTFVTDN